MLTLNTLEPGHHVLCRDGAPIGELRVELAVATRVVALLNLAGWVEEDTARSPWRLVSIDRDYGRIAIDAHSESSEDARKYRSAYGSGATLDEALADLGDLS